MPGLRATLVAQALACALALPVRAAEPWQDTLLRDHLWRETLALPKGERPVVGLVLSAGGMRGLAHVGVLRALDQAGFPIDVISGVSVGAVVGSLYAGGIPLSRLWSIRDMRTLKISSNFNAVRMLRLLVSDSLLSSQNMEKTVQDALGNKRFDQLEKPFACVAMDIKTGEPILFREGPVAPAVRASMNLPGIFAPVEYRHRYLVDGGVVDYIPVGAARLLGAEWILASVTEGDYTRQTPTNVLTTLEQVIDIRGALLSREQRRLAQVVIEPPVGDILFYQDERAGEAMDKGLAAAMRKLPEARESLILYALPRLNRRWSAGSAAGRR